MAEIEVWVRAGRRTVPLAAARATIGKDDANDIVLTGDPTVSRLHALVEEFAAGWCVSDVDATNGTFLNGERIWGRRRLHDGDELRIGHARLVFRQSTRERLRSSTASELDRPTLTPRERDVLGSLCRPLLDRDLFTEPATIREVAAELVVSEAAIKQHLTNLYKKFDIEETDVHRRAKLANEALRRGVLTLADLEREPPA